MPHLLPVDCTASFGHPRASPKSRETFGQSAPELVHRTRALFLRAPIRWGGMSNLRANEMCRGGGAKCVGFALRG